MTSPPRERPRPVAGRVVSVETIPDSEHVRLATVDIGTEQLSIVFGGTYVPPEGTMVPVAPPGSWVPGPKYERRNPVKMRRRRYRRQDSYGMLCSLRELGWAKGSQDRVPELREGLEPGSALPELGGWRHLVVDPDPRGFEPNTVEMSLADISALLDRGRTTGDQSSSASSDSTR